MKISSKFSLALLAGTILSTPTNYVAAATLTPTLDTIKAEAADISGSYKLDELSGNLPEGAAEVEIAGVKYYFTPTGEDAALLKTLAGTVAGNLKEDENGIFEFDGKKYSFDVAAIPSSVFEYAEGTAEDYNFTMQEADAEGNITTKYYKVVLKPETSATSEKIKWEFLGRESPSSDFSDKDLIDDNQIKGYVYYEVKSDTDPYPERDYYGYTYTKPEGYEIVNGKPLDFEFNKSSGTTVNQPGGAAINNPEGETYEDIKSKVFANNKVTGSISGGTSSSKKNELYLYGGVIYNAGEMGNVNADFINNSVVATGQRYNYAYAYGGAIYNAENAIISNIIGDFIGNYAEGYNYAYGGAIYNAENATIGNITADFIGNYAKSSGSSTGGAIYNYNGTIGDITGDFIGNYAYTYGGAIYNTGTIGDIIGDFIGNYAQGDYSTSGGAIYNYNGTIGDITGDFIGNHAHNGGGAISSGSFGNITGDFIGNHTGTASNYYGGAINGGTIESIAGNFIGNFSGYGGAISGGTINNITGDFIDNYAEHSGGAIYNSSITNIAGNFIGNYADAGGAIYNQDKEMGNITGDFIGNYAQSDRVNGAFGGAIYNEPKVTIKTNLPDNPIYHLTIKYGNEEAEIYTLPQGSELSANIQMISGTLTVNSEYYFNRYKNQDIRAPLTSMLPQLQKEYAQVESMIEQLPAMMDYIRDISVDDLTAEQYVDYLTMTGASENMIEDFRQSYQKDASAAMTEARDDVANGKQSVEIYDYVSAISVDDLTAEQYVDYLTMTGASENMIEDFRQSYQEDASAAMVQAKEAITEIKEQMSGEAELNKIAEEIEQTENALAIIESGTPVTEITATVDTEGGINFYNSSFRDNYVKSENGEAKGGAIYGNRVTITADNYTSIVDGNKANDESNAFYVLTTPISDKDMENAANNELAEFEKDAQSEFYYGNLDLDLSLRGEITNAEADLTLNTVNNGVILLNDGIDGVSGYSLAFNGDKGVDEAGTAGGLSLFNSAGDGRTTQYIKLNNRLANAGNISITNTTLSFGEGPYGRGEITADGDPITKVSLQNAAFDLYNNHLDEVKLAGWSASNSYLHVDVDVENLTADILNINGNVEGTTKLVLYPTSAKDITGKSIVFATATGDTKGTEDSFTVYRVYRSPYMFKVGMTGAGTTEHEWYLTMTDEKNEFAGVEPGEQPDPEVPDVDIPDIDIPDINIPTAPVYGEVVAYGALPAAALEQTRNMVDNVGGQVAATRTQDAAANYNLWVNPTYYTSNIDSPFAIDADIWGIEAGGDIQRDVHNRLGIFVSYRQGEYDMNGNGDKYRSPVGSEIDIDSYIAGLYYRYDHNNWYAFATLYGGIQEADIKTDDGMKFDTDGVEFGASAEVGYDYALTDSVTLTPELGVFYTQVNYDDAKDNVGKSASYDDARQIELEAGVKLAKTFMTDESFANVYVKPSVVQTIVDGDEVNITGLGDVEALDDATLGRIEIGGRYGFTTNLSAYGWANYTFGSDYDATTFGLGLNYAF